MNLYKSIQKILRNWAHGGYNGNDADVYIIIKNEIEKHEVCKKCTLQEELDDIQNPEDVCLDKRLKKRRK